ncbi:MAG: hypothetical protein ACYSOT_05385 [Planctomycetota bacterium]|jgi:hypothetical protein
MKLSILSLVCLSVLIAGWTVTAPISAMGNKIDTSEVTAQQQQGENLAEKLGITETLGPLAPVALSPFFGLACLSGASMLCDSGILPGNEFLAGNEVLNNPLVFVVFTLLTLLTSVPRLLSVSKIFAEATERIETYAGIISYGVVLMAAQQDAGAEQVEQMVVAAGFFTMPANMLLACCAAVNIFVIATVRFFFELLTLISPIPTLDAIFECSNKAVAGILITIYAFSPWLAFVLNIILFLICLVIFKWVNRRVKYMKAMLLEPVMVGTVRSMLGRINYDPDRGVQRKLARQFGDIALVIKCFPSCKLGKIKKKDRCWLAFGSDGVHLVMPRLLGATVSRKLNAADLSGEVAEGLLGYSISLKTDGGKDSELIFSSVYTAKLDAIREVLTSQTDASPQTPNS